MNAPAAADYVARAARPSDVAGFVQMKHLAGPGLTSLAGPDAAIEEYVAASTRAFADPAPQDAHYFLALEHVASGAIVGMAQVKAQIGVTKPFFNYRLLKIAQASSAAQRRFDLELLVLVNEYTGCTEIGSLFVRAEHRRAGIGRALARARYMMMAAAPERFGARVVAELRGVVTADGASPFWEHLGRPFFQMSFEEADRLSATSDNQFIVDLMPKYPIYVSLLPEAARAVIGRAHEDGAGARKLLEQEGFRYDGVVDVFDGGPVMTAPREAIETVRSACRRLLRAEPLTAPAIGLVAQPRFEDFRCTAAALEDAGGHVRAAWETFAALGLRDGDEALVCLP